jgi:predicted transcriptional regulator
MQRSYRERIYIVKDIILKLVEYGELNQTALISCCGLNFKKHSPILGRLETKGLISKDQIEVGKRTVTAYRPTQISYSILNNKKNTRTVKEKKAGRVAACVVFQLFFIPT